MGAREAAVLGEESILLLLYWGISLSQLLCKWLLQKKHLCYCWVDNSGRRFCLGTKVTPEKRNRLAFPFCVFPKLSRRRWNIFHVVCFSWKCTRRVTGDRHGAGFLRNCPGWSWWIGTHSMLHGMQHPPGPGLEPSSPAPAGGLPTTAPPGKPWELFLKAQLSARSVLQPFQWFCRHPTPQLITCVGASLVAQWLRTHLPVQGTWVRALVREDPTPPGATKPMRHNYWARMPRLLSLSSRAHEPQLLSPHATTTEARAPRARAPQEEKPPQWEAHALQRRVAPAHRNQRKPAHSNEDPMQPKINKINKFI